MGDGGVDVGGLEGVAEVTVEVEEGEERFEGHGLGGRDGLGGGMAKSIRCIRSSHASHASGGASGGGGGSGEEEGHGNEAYFVTVSYEELANPREVWVLG